MSARLTRRSLIAGAGASMIAGSHHAFAAMPARIAAIDWAMLETTLALGVTPVAATELLQFRQVAIEPAVPQGVSDLGLRGVPNFELLRMTAPDLILISAFYERLRPRVEPVAPVLSLSVYLPGELPYALAEAATRKLGERLGSAETAEQVISRTSRAITHHAESVRRIKRPVYLVSFGDARHVRMFGTDSMFGDVLNRMGLTNAWASKTSYSATAPVGLEALALEPEAAIVVIGPTPQDVARTLSRNALWQALPAVSAKRIFTLDPVNHFGALPAAERFARLLAHAVTASGEGARG